MILNESQPTLAGIAAAVRTSEVTCDAPFADGKAELQQFTMDLGGSPSRILSGQTSNQRAHFIADLWSASAPTRSPAPVQPKAGPMPSYHCFGFDDKEHILPARPKAVQEDPEQPVARVQGGRGRFRLRAASCCRRARTSSAVAARQRKKTRMAAKSARQKWSTNQPL